ncbi:TPA: hypothetical protein ACGUON_000717 [Vibrio vulnificus]|uniref:hypothetical protein n=1 Tax=Vibrio vulnificus TaxID=672 RepID=UPI0028C0C75A|nr:hypothetical protein [Vibrio vulnificus]
MKSERTERNKRYYQKKKDQLLETARQKRENQMHLKTFGELMTELATAAQHSEAKFIESVSQITNCTINHVGSVYNQLKKDLRLSEQQRLSINNDSLLRQELIKRL